MKRTFLLLAAIAVLLILPLCSAINNPAAEFCINEGNSYGIKYDTGGNQYGVCISGDKEEDAWKLYGQSNKFNNQLNIKRSPSTDKKDNELIKETSLDKLKITGSDKAETLPYTESYPSNFDWRNYNSKNWLTPIKDQGGCGSCWAFSAVGITESKVDIGLNDSNYNIDLSEQDLVSCSGAGDCGGGAYSTALSYMKNNGIVRESCFGYTATNNVCSNKCTNWDNELVKVNYANINGDANSIKEAIANHGPITAYMVVCYNFDGVGIDNHGGDVYWDYSCWNSDHTSLNWHAIDVVGYDDSGQYWIGRNSWGSTWGNQGGYFKIVYQDTVYDYSSWFYNVFYTSGGDDRIFFLDDSYVVSSTDIDNDGIDDSRDNCPTIFNPNQEDTDNSSLENCNLITGKCGNICDSDDDNDGILDINDNCPIQAGPICNNGCPDTTAPVITISSPLAIRYFNPQILIALIANDNILGISSNMQSKEELIKNKLEQLKGKELSSTSSSVGISGCLQSVWMNNGTSNIMINSPYYQYYNFSIGQNNIIFYANDTSGNTGVNNVSFVINTSRQQIQCQENNFIVHNCSLVNSVSSIDGIALNPTLYKKVNYTIQINWTGWHFWDENYWTFFLNDSLVPIKTCTSYENDYNIGNLYTMNCIFSIPENISLGNYTLKLTANDFLGYCTPEENGTDAQYSFPIAFDCFDNWIINDTWSNCDINDTQYKNYYDINDCHKNVTPTSLNQSCDYCTPNWKANSVCKPDDSLTVWYNDSNVCFSKTGLSSDLQGKPDNQTSSFSCDFDKDGFIGDLTNVNSLINLSLGNLNGTIIFKEENRTLFEFNSSNVTINFANLFIEKQPTNNSFAYLIINGLDLTSQNKTKIAYINKILNGTGICIKDAEITSITEVSASCTGSNEFWLRCPGINGAYSCNLTENNTVYQISGLKHSGVKEQPTFCGDGTCNGAETCSSCSSDCGTCPVPPSGGGGGGGGGSGGSGGGSGGRYVLPATPNTTQSIKSDTNQTNKTTNESETDKGGAPITGGVIGIIKGKGGYFVVGFIVIIVLAVIIIFNRSKIKSIMKKIKFKSKKIAKKKRKKKKI
ncbi:MAG: C1 family peptidase [Nanoarchaeota archaeon]